MCAEVELCLVIAEIEEAASIQELMVGYYNRRNSSITMVLYIMKLFKTSIWQDCFLFLFQIIFMPKLIFSGSSFFFVLAYVV